MALINNSTSREKSACPSMVIVHCVQSIVHESKAWFLDSKIWCLKEISKNQEKFNNILSNPFLQEGKYILKSSIPASRPSLEYSHFSSTLTPCSYTLKQGRGNTVYISYSYPPLLHGIFHRYTNQTHHIST